MSYEVARVPVAPEPLVGSEYDYADSFELRLSQPDTHSAEEWVRAGLEGAPGWIRAVILCVHARVIRFELEPTATDHVLGWRIAISSADVVHLTAVGPLLRAHIVARRLTPTTAQLTTLLFYERRVTRLLWRCVGPLHRAIAPVLLRRAARKLTGARPYA